MKQTIKKMYSLCLCVSVVKNDQARWLSKTSEWVVKTGKHYVQQVSKTSGMLDYLHDLSAQVVSNMSKMIPQAQQNFVNENLNQLSETRTSQLCTSGVQIVQNVLALRLPMVGCPLWQPVPIPVMTEHNPPDAEAIQSTDYCLLKIFFSIISCFNVYFYDKDVIIYKQAQ